MFVSVHLFLAGEFKVGAFLVKDSAAVMFCERKREQHEQPYYTYAISRIVMFTATRLVGRRTKLELVHARPKANPVYSRQEQVEQL